MYSLHRSVNIKECDFLGTNRIFVENLLVEHMSFLFLKESHSGLHVGKNWIDLDNF